MRNPKWHRDEIILALNLYFDSDRGPISSSNIKIIELSEMLGRLKIDVQRNDAEKFRNPNGVTLKLSNFLSMDPNYPGEGMNRHSKLDAEIFNEFINDRIRLKEEVARIKSSTM
jgi:5-methylcytosine-specific restriction protein A